MNSRRVEEKDLKPGVLYKVEFTDCCIQGSFTSRYKGEFDGVLIFENGVNFGVSYCCEYEEIETEDNPLF